MVDPESIELPVLIYGNPGDKEVANQLRAETKGKVLFREARAFRKDCVERCSKVILLCPSQALEDAYGNKVERAYKEKAEVAPAKAPVKKKRKSR